MEPIRNVFITPKQFEEIQSKYDGICEYLNGEILFSSRTSQNHNRIVRRLLSRLDEYFDGSNCEPFSKQIEVIFKNENEQYNLLPDIFIMCEDAETLGESFISSPKIVFEVVSEKYSDNDYFIKARIYQKFGVLEYNIVEPSGSITQYTLVNGSYGTPKVFYSKDTFVSSLYKDLKINLEKIFKSPT
ncbi:Uma2 family endonuclease [Clostridium sp. P21]|uniref:Uma2 family endonuclease n=1 Tax=Clostridium muellerianum TaxID=2716538 RepID=A0A7Y0EJR8_9CLOT|nr:Uma2 family endonuclease [Clostridium muellerianum]NMM63715.1 Uma2 family endonuclease [Clostridium muellerianum]